MKNNDLKNLILKECLRGRFYGYEINKKLAARGVRIEIGRLYIILNQMEKEKLISSCWEKSSKGPKKKYYQISENGEKLLYQETIEAIEIIHQAYGTYLMKTETESIFHQITLLAIDKPLKSVNITYFSDDFSPMHERLLSTIQEITSEAKIYFVRPKEKNNQSLSEVIYLRGEYDNFPLKDNFSKVLFINGFPEKEKVARSIQEWARVIECDGKIAVIVPTIILHKPKDPMSMTDFIEQLEHKTSEKYDHNWIMEMMNNFFVDVEEKEILHITIIVGTKKINPKSS